MKRKIFSKLLMGALLVASVSSFTSCKDYDDDINDLRNKIDQAALKSSLATLESQVASIKATADAAATKSEAATKVDLEAVKSDLAAAKTEAMAKATQGITDAATAQAAADEAKTLAKEAKAAADAIDLSAYAKTADVAAMAEGAEASFKAALADYKTASEIQEMLDALKLEIETANEEKLAELKKKVDNAVEGVKAIWSAVTNISLYKNLQEYATTPATGAGTTVEGTFDGKDFRQYLTYGRVNKAANHYTTQKMTAGVPANQANDATFGKNDYYKNDGSYTAAANTSATFNHGDYVRPTNSIVVRVSPANADLSTASFKFMDTKGNDLSKLVEVAKVSAYTETAQTTRAGSVTGLWKIEFRLKDEVTAANLISSTRVVVAATGATPTYNTYKQYAIAVNNTADEDAERYAVSEYDVTFREPVNFAGISNLGASQIATNTSFNAAGGVNTLGAIKGRDLDNSTPGAVSTNAKYTDYNWDDAGATNGATAIAAGTTRNGNVAYAVNNGQTFYVRAGGANGNSRIKYAYIIRDDKNANVSNDASELNAWIGYTYTGLNTLVEGNVVPVSVTIPSSLNLGDEVAFRLFAVNYDGTLADPDGYPFTVFVGNEIRTANVTGTFAATKEFGLTAVFDITGDIVTGMAFPAGANLGGFNLYSGTTVKHVVASAVLLKADGETLADSWANAKKVLVTFGSASTTSIGNTAKDDGSGLINRNSMANWKDNATLTGSIPLSSGTPATRDFTITFSLTKTLPTAEAVADLWSWKAEQLKSGVFKAVMYPEGAINGANAMNPVAWKARRQWAYKGMNNAINGLVNNAGAYISPALTDPIDGEFYFSFANSILNADNNAWTETAWLGKSPAAVVNHAPKYDGYILNLNENAVANNMLKSILDNTTQHASTINYNFGYVSSENYEEDVITSLKTFAKYGVKLQDFQTVFACPFHQLDVKTLPYTEGRKLNAAGTAWESVGDQAWNYVYYGNATIGSGMIDNTGAAFNPTAAQITSWIPVTSQIGADYVVGTLANLTNHCIPNDAAGTGIKAQFVSLNADGSFGNEDYFTAVVSTAGAITLTPTPSGMTDMGVDVKSALVLTCLDFAGHEHVYSIPFTVKTRAVVTP